MDGGPHLVRRILGTEARCEIAGDGLGRVHPDRLPLDRVYELPDPSQSEAYDGDR